MDLLARLESWYAAHCDGQWEHWNGIVVETLDNPGWRVRIDLGATELHGRTFQPVRRSSGPDWIDCDVERGRFVGAGGPGQLREILATFLDWAEMPAGGS